MASITAQERTTILKLVAGMFNAAPGATFLNGFTDAFVAMNKDYVALATALGQSEPFKSLYPSFLTAEEFANKFLATLGLKDNTNAQDWVQARKNAGEDNASIIFQALVAIETSTADEFKAARDQLANKAAVAEYYSVTLGLSSDDLGVLQGVLAGVSADAATVQTAKDALTAADTANIYLTVGQDTLPGTAGNDLFKASVVQNPLGEQTNSLATGDHIDGGAGQDSLFATVQQASALNQGPASAIMPSTVSVETVEFRALADNNEGEGSLANDRVVINAKDMLGVETLGSVHSDASLLIKDVTTLTNNGEYADKRETSALTVRMDHTGNGNAVDRASDLTVLFDNDYLIPTGTNQSVANYWLLDEDAELVGNPDRLANIDVNGLSFTIDGEVFNVYAVANPLVDLFSGSHAEFVAALQADLAEQQAAGTIPDYISISLDPNNTRTTGLENGTLSNPIPAIVISSTGDVVGPRGFNRPEDTPGEYDVWARLNNDASSTSLITATIELEKVGRGADGGELIVGGMATDWLNEWDFSESALEEGVEQFNITVSGDATQNSSLSSLKSTNNTLQVVNVVSAAGSEADLFIGNANTILTADNASLKDVRVFDSTAFANDVILTRAVISDEAADKYMDLWDDALDATGTQPAADNIDFIYSFGAGDDVLEINIDKSNLAWVGSTTREDFSFTANMGDGDDAVHVDIGDGLATSELDHWYVNSTLNKNLDINAGAGDDFVWTHGSGTWQINMGTGSDTVYSDQSGDTAVWVFNTYHNALDGAGTLAARELDNLRSSENTQFGSLFKTKLVVNFRGVESTIVLGAEVNTDLELNQYIKAAINNDDVLGELLVAEDGPANTLVVYSLVDGAVVAEDLALTFVAPVAAEFNQADVNAYAAAYNVSAATLSPAALEALVAANLAGFNLQNDYASRLANDDGTAATEFNGSNSTQVTESTITVNLDATDVIVLSTGAASEESIILEGTQDALPLVILNFDAANGDTIQYRSANGLETTRVTGDQVEILNTEGTWDVVAVVEFATAAGGTDPVVPGQTNQIVANGVNYDASTGAFNYILDFSLTPKEDWAADIAGFGADDTVTVINAGGAARPMFGTQPAATDFDFAYVLNDYSASWTLTMTGQDAALVADVLQGAVGGVVAGAAADAAVVELTGVWGADWLNLAS